MSAASSIVHEKSMPGTSMFSSLATSDMDERQATISQMRCTDGHSINSNRLAKSVPKPRIIKWIKRQLKRIATSAVAYTVQGR